MRAYFIILFTLLSAACLFGAQQVTRIGIVSIQEETRGPADLLTAGLTANTDIALVERNDLDKAMREHGLAKGGRADIAEFGRLLHADGLVLLETVGASNTLQLAVRLIAVNTGVVLDAAVYPLPLQDASEWSGLTATRLVRIKPKLLVPRERAIPISILNLHAAIDTTQAAETERTLSTLLYHRLAAEPQIFVLERRQLGRAGFEKTLALEDKGFWTGGYLLEGSIDRDGPSASTVAINAQLVPPLNGKRISLEISGPRSSLPELANQLASRIISELNVESKGANWDMSAEAEQFEKESLWALRWRMWPEAASMAESAWQLSRHTEAVAAARIQALLGQLAPHSTTSSTRSLTLSSPERRPEYDPIRDVAWRSDPPQAAEVGYVIEAASTYTGISNLPESTWKTNASWISLGTNTLSAASKVIAAQYHFGWRLNQFHPDLSVLREETRNLAATLPEEQTRPFIIRLGAFWQESPADSAEIFRKGIELGGFPLNLVFFRQIDEPFWVAWSPADRETGKKTWTALISDLQGSTNRTVQAQAALLKLHRAFLDDEIAEAQGEFLNAVLDETERRFSTNVSFSVLDTFDQVWSNRCSRVITLRRTRLWNAWKEFDFARAKHYLQTARVHNIDRAGWPYARRFFTQDQAREMIPVVEDYLRRVGGDWMQTVLERVRALASKPTDPFEEVLARLVFDPEAFGRVFEGRKLTAEESKHVAGLVRPYGNRHGWPKELSDFAESLKDAPPALPVRTNQPDFGPVSWSGTSMPASSPVGQLAFSNSAVLYPTRQISPVLRLPDGRSVPAKSGTWLEDQGRIITVSMTPRSEVAFWPGVGEKGLIIETDLSTGESRTLTHQINLEPNAAAVFQMIGDQFFWIASSNQIGVLHRISGRTRMHTLDVPLSMAYLIKLNNRLFLTSPDYLAQLSLEDGTIELLASKRRKPAANSIDAWDGWSRVPSVWLHNPETLLAYFGGTNVWTWNPDARDWKEWSSQERAGVPFSITSEGTTNHYATFQMCIDGSRRTLLSTDRADLPMWPIPFDYSGCVWRSIGRDSRLYDGTNLFLLLPPAVPANPPHPTQTHRLTDRDFTLLWFDPRWELPRSVPVRLRPPAERFGQGELVFTNTSSGLLLYYRNPLFGPFPSTLWLFSWSDLHKWVAEHQPDTRNLPRSQPERERRFDKDRNGILSSNELAAMNSDSSWKQQEQNRFVRRMFLTFDVNADDKLTLPELTHLTEIEDPAVFKNSKFNTTLNSPMRSGRPWEPEFLLRKFDRNRDQTVDATESERLFNHILTSIPAPWSQPGAPQTRINAPNNGLPAFGGLRPYDLDGNGIIDPQEREAVPDDTLRIFSRNPNGFHESQNKRSTTPDPQRRF